MKRLSIHEKGEYLSDVVFAASDGIITTFAVVAGSAGALLEPRIVVILGFANLFADGFSMASGSYIGAKSEMEYEKARGQDASKEGRPLFHGIVNFIAFNLAGLIPLAPFVFDLEPKFGFSIIFVIFGLFAVGALRNIYTKKGLVKSATESIFVGGIAALVAFVSGYLIEKYII